MQGTCESQSEDGFKYKYDGIKKGGSRCQKGKEVKEKIEIDVEIYKSCSDIKDMNVCQNSMVKVKNV